MPPTYTTNYALAKPDPADAIDVTLINANMDKLDGYIPVFANTSLRDTAYAAQPFKMCIVGASIDIGTLQVVRAGKWFNVAGQVTGAANRTAALIVANGAYTEVPMAALDNSIAGGAANQGLALVSSRLVIPVAGWYQVNISGNYDASPTGYRIIALALAGVARAEVLTEVPASPVGINTIITASGIVYFAVGAALSVTANQSSGAGLNIQNTRLNVALVG